MRRGGSCALVDGGPYERRPYERRRRHLFKYVHVCTHMHTKYHKTIVRANGEEEALYKNEASRINLLQLSFVFFSLLLFAANTSD